MEDGEGKEPPRPTRGPLDFGMTVLAVLVALLLDRVIGTVSGWFGV